MGIPSSEEIDVKWDEIMKEHNSSYRQDRLELARWVAKKAIEDTDDVLWGEVEVIGNQVDRLYGGCIHIYRRLNYWGMVRLYGEKWEKIQISNKTLTQIRDILKRMLPKPKPKPTFEEAKAAIMRIPEIVGCSVQLQDLEIIKAYFTNDKDQGNPPE